MRTLWGVDGGKWFWRAVAAGTVGNGLRLRQRVAALEVIAPSDQPRWPGYMVVTAAGVEVDAATLRAASRHAAAQGLEALDLVPADLPSERLLDLVWLTDPSTFREAPLARGRGALTALLLTRDLADRLGVGATSGLRPIEMLRLTAEAKRHAPLRTDLAVAPGLRAAVDDDAAGRYAGLEASFSVAAPIVVGTKAASLALLARGALGRRPAALAAVAAHGLVPWIATRGTAVAPRDLPSRVPVRLVAAATDLARSVALRRRGTPTDADAADLAAQRLAYDRAFGGDGGGLDALFAPRRDDCPMCGAGSLRHLLTMPEMNQGKPGTFRLDECTACGHVFQNPCLTPAGLEVYYRDFYDGAGAEHTELIFGAGIPSYRGRADLVAGATTPRRWLDVGAGHGHFCMLARTIWPDATFDGLDMTDGIDQADLRGWVDRGWRGAFPDLVPELAGAYDVVSMHHYLEHTVDPGAELDAATKVLEPGGHLLIELPDASSWLGRRLGRYWAPWLQPQHLHFMTVERVETLLRDRGFTVVARQRAEPHQPAELLLGLYLAISRLCPPVDVPWRPPSTRGDRWRRGGLLALASPLFLAAVLVDGIMAPTLRRTGASNAFRILARAPGGSPGEL